MPRCARGATARRRARRELAARAAFVAERAQAVVPTSRRCARPRPCGRGLRERPERRARGVLEHLQAHGPGAGAPDLDGDADLLARWRPPLMPSFQAAEEELVDLDLVLERLALRGDHRPAQLGKISDAVS
jgi:hypothetical protein